MIRKMNEGRKKKKTRGLLTTYICIQLPFHCQWQDVKDLFRNAGNILRADVVQGPDGRSRGFGTVLFATYEDAKKAMGK